MNETRQLFGRDDVDVFRGQLLRDPVSREALAGALALSVVTRRSASRKSSRRWKNASSTCVRSAKSQTRGEVADAIELVCDVVKTHLAGRTAGIGTAVWP